LTPRWFGCLRARHSNLEVRVIPGRHVEVQVVTVTWMAWSQDDAKHVGVDDLVCQRAQELTIQAPEFGAFGVPVLSDGNSKRTLGVFGRRRALCFGRRCEAETDHVEGVAERVFAKARGAIARLTAGVRARVQKSARRPAVNVERDAIDDRLETRESFGERWVDEHATRIRDARALVGPQRGGVAL